METMTKIVKQDDKVDFYDKINDCCRINILKKFCKWAACEVLFKDIL